MPLDPTLQQLAMVDQPPSGSFPPGKTPPSTFLQFTREPHEEQGGAAPRPSVENRGLREFNKALAAGLGKEEAAYIRHMENTVGTEEFMKIYEQLKNDNSVNAVAIANHFYGPVAKSTSRQKALDRILTRHRKVFEFEPAQAPTQAPPAHAPAQAPTLWDTLMQRLFGR